MTLALFTPPGYLNAIQQADQLIVRKEVFSKLLVQCSVEAQDMYYQKLKTADMKQETKLSVTYGKITNI